MKPGKPLKTNKPLKQGKPLATHKPLKAKKGLTTRTGLQAKTTLKTKTKLKFRSKKMEEIYVKRRQLVSKLLTERADCEAHWDSGCTGKAVDVHELLARSLGGAIVGAPDDAYLTVCRYCHTQITNNPAEARKRGLALSPWETMLD